MITFVLALIVIYLVLGAQFESFRIQHHIEGCLGSALRQAGAGRRPEGEDLRAPHGFAARVVARSSADRRADATDRLVTYAETLSVYGTEAVFVDGDDTPWSKAFLACAAAATVYG